jgi:hypothetical protein
MPLRTVTRRFGIAAPRVAVYTQLPWYWQLAFAAVTIIIVVGLAWATFLLGQRFAFRPFDPNAATRETTLQALDRFKRENESLRSQLATLEQKLKIDGATHASLNEQLKTVTDQNAKIKEELAFFQAIGGDSAAVSVQRFTVKAEAAAPGDFHFRLLIVQSKQRAEHFRGRIELVVNVVDKGVHKTLVYPRPGEKTQPFVLGFKFFQRMEGLFTVPQGASVTRVEARVFEAGVDTPHVTQVATLS